MDMLIDTKYDVAKLVESKVLVNNMGSNEEATNYDEQHMQRSCLGASWSR